MTETGRTLKEQTREYILAYIREQDLHPGDRLPSQREVARTLKVSPKISEVVFCELEAEKVIIRQGGRGSFLAATNEQGCTSLGGRNVFLVMSSIRNPHFADYAAKVDYLLRCRGK